MGRPETLAILFERGRGNSVGFLRFFLAACVVLSHSYTLGGAGPEPLHRATGETLGTHALHAFFVLSGLLVARSYATCASFGRYLWHRLLRIFPAFWLCLVLSALVIGPLIMRSTEGAFAPRAYFSMTPSPAGYVWNNLLLRMRQLGIGELLSTTRFGNTLNGAAWTLEHELRCYLGLGLLGLFGLFGARRRLGRHVSLVLFAGLLLLRSRPALLPAVDEHELVTLRLAVWFAAGMAAYGFAERIPLRAGLFAASLAITVIAYVIGAQAWLVPITLPYALFFLAYRLPLGWWDRRADLSYGVYIYAFPLQQLMATTRLGQAGPLPFFALAMACATAAAVLSWFAVERPALRLKDLGRGRGDNYGSRAGSATI